MGRAVEAEDERRDDGVPTLSARLFGEFDLRLGDERLARVESARGRSLLAYLILHGGVPHAREHLAFLLWPDSTEAQAKTNLRNVLHTVRRAVPKLDRFLEITPRTLQLRPDSQYWVDVAAFTAAADRADEAPPRSDGVVDALRAAIALYSGDLLDGCYDEWVIPERERLRDRYLSVLRRLASALADRGDHSEAVRMAREFVRGDPLNEDAHRLLIEIHANAGDRAGAVRAYHACAATLERELGVEPSPPTRQAYAALMARDERSTETRGRMDSDNGDVVALADGLVPAPPDQKGSNAPFVGRDAEWAQATECWRAAAKGRSQLLIVTGEAGVGKTRLVEELGAWCAHRGAIVAPARAYATEGDLAYGSVVAWLRSADLADHVRRAEPGDAAELARLLPELGGTRDEPPGEVHEAEQRRRLFDVISRTIVAPDGPTVLVVDDAQWADAQSLQLIHYLVRQAADQPLLVVATIRREELDETHPLVGLIGGLQIMGRAFEIALDRLDRAATETLVRHFCGDDVDEARINALFAETEGNPLFIVESTRVGSAGGAGAGGALSPKLKAVISHRLQQLSAPARELLGVAATVGREFTAALLGRASHLDAVTMVRALDELWRRGVIREHGGDAYDFSHGKIREVAYNSLSPAMRRRMHAVVAAALAADDGGESDVLSGQIARHYDAGGEHGDAVRWYVRAAGQAMRLHATTEAVRVLDRAQELLPSLSGDDALHAELDVLSVLAAALAGVEGFASDRLSSVQQRAVEVADRLGVELAAPVPRSMVISRLCRDEFVEALGAAERLQVSAQRSGDHGLDVESRYLLGITAFWSADFETARSCFEEVAVRFDADQRGEHLLRFGHDPKVVCVSRLANTLWFLGRTDEARRARDAAREMAAEAGHPYSTDVALVFAAMLAVDLGEHDAVAAVADALCAPGDHATPLRINGVAFAGYADVVAGRVDEGLERIRGAILSCGARNHAPGFRASLIRLLVGATDIAGDAALGLVVADEALRLPGTRIWEPEIRRVRGEFLAAAGADPADVSAELERAAAIAIRQGALGPLARVELSRSRLAVAG